MEKVKNLYPNTPPTVLRNREEKFRTAKNIPFWHWIADYAFSKMFAHRFYSLMIKNDKNLELRDKNFATIFYAPHSNWWDGIMGYLFIRNYFKKKTKFRLMIEEMNRFPLFQYIGCFPINKRTAQTAMKSLKYCLEFFSDPNVNYWLFPQGIINPPDHRPMNLQSGLAYIVQNSAKRYGGINLVPVAVKYAFLREDKPEVLFDFGEPTVITDGNFDKKEFTQKIEKDFELLCDNQIKEVSNGNLEGYHYLIKQRLSWWKKIEKKLKNVGMSADNKLSTK